MIIKSSEIEERAIERIADLICVAARTAPKGRGVDNLVTMLVKGREKDQIADEMRKLAKTAGQHFERDANCVDKAAIIILFGQRVKHMGVPSCGYCGFANCQENINHSGLCAISIGDLGIAIGSAVSVAANHHVDNRLMFTIGRAALNVGVLGEDVDIAYGLPLSISGKSPFHDRA